MKNLFKRRLGVLVSTSVVVGATLMLPEAASAAPPVNDTFVGAAAVSPMPFSPRVDTTESTTAPGSAESQRASESAALALGWFPIAGPYLAAPPQVRPQDDLLFLLALDGSAYMPGLRIASRVVV